MRRHCASTGTGANLATGWRSRARTSRRRRRAGRRAECVEGPHDYDAAFVTPHEGEGGLAREVVGQFLDVRRNPRKPRLLAVGTNNDRRMHTARWPRAGEDRFMMTTFETNADVRCSETSGEFSTWDTRAWRTKRKFTVIDQYRVASGTYLDGRPAANQLGCSAHWFTEHPNLRNGGLVAAGFYEHGTRFLKVGRTGKIREVGYFMGWGGSTSAAYWVTDSIVYAVDYSRGIDILRFNRKAKPGTTAEVQETTWERLGAAAAVTPTQFVCRVGA